LHNKCQTCNTHTMCTMYSELDLTVKTLPIKVCTPATILVQRHTAVTNQTLALSQVRK